MTVEFENLSPEERTVRILVMGNAIALRRYQHIQHSLRFAEINDWSKIIVQPDSEEAMTMLIKLLR